MLKGAQGLFAIQAPDGRLLCEEDDMGGAFALDEPHYVRRVLIYPSRDRAQAELDKFHGAWCGDCLVDRIPTDQFKVIKLEPRPC